MAERCLLRVLLTLVLPPCSPAMHSIHRNHHPVRRTVFPWSAKALLYDTAQSCNMPRSKQQGMLASCVCNRMKGCADGFMGVAHHWHGGWVDSTCAVLCAEIAMLP